MNTTPRQPSNPPAKGGPSIGHLLPLVLALAALALPGRSFAQAPTFNTVVATPTGSQPWLAVRPAAVGDFNGDGKADALIVDGTGVYHFMRGNGDGTFARTDIGAPQLTTSNVVGLNPNLVPYLPNSVERLDLVRAVDVNGDGKLDAVLSMVSRINWNPYSFSTVLLNTGNDASGVPQFAATHYALNFYDVRSLTVGDLNADGRPDYIIGSAYGGLYVHLNNGSGGFAISQTTNIQPSAGNPAVGAGAIADINGDGKADFIVASGQANATNVFLGNGNGTFQPPTQIPGAASSVAIADLNDDGKRDLIQGFDGNVAVYLGNGNGTFGSAASFSTGASGYPSGFFVSDVNGDGKLDVAASLMTAGKIAILTGNGDGTLGAANLFGPVPNAVDVTLADFTGDTKPDIAAVSANGYGGQNFDVLKNMTPFGPPPATPPVIFTRSSTTGEGWKKYTISFIPTQSGEHTLNFNVIAGGPTGDNSIVVDAVSVTTGATTLLSDGFETPALNPNTEGLVNVGTATIGNWVFTNYSGILDGSPANWGFDLQGLGTADGTTQYAVLRAVAGTLSKMTPVTKLTLVAGQTYTVSYYQASRRDFGGQLTYTVTIEKTPTDTTPPVIAAPGDIVAEATGPTGAAVGFVATATDDVDGSVAVAVSPLASGSTFPLGATIEGLAASDKAGNTATASFKVTVQDTKAPVIATPANLTREATGVLTPVSYAVSATDVVDGNRPVTASPSSNNFPVGTTKVTLTSSDTRGNGASSSFNVTISDTTAPTVASVAPSSAALWPPNHQMVAITLSVSASDAVGVKGYYVTATSNEPDNGLGDGDTPNDIQITGSGTLNPVVNLRAERSGKGNGRVYTISVVAFDAAGNQSGAKTCTVSVAKSQGGK